MLVACAFHNAIKCIAKRKIACHNVKSNTLTEAIAYQKPKKIAIPKAFLRRCIKPMRQKVKG